MRTFTYVLFVLFACSTFARAEGIPLKELINDIRQELVELKGEDHSQKMLLDGIKLELQTIITKTGEGKIRYLVVEAGGKYEQSQIQKFTFDLTLPDDQKQVYNYSSPAIRKRDTAPGGFAAAGWEDGNVLIFADQFAKQAAGKILRAQAFEVTELPMGMNISATLNMKDDPVITLYKQPIPVRDVEGNIIGYVVDPENIKNPVLKKLNGVFLSEKPNTVIQPEN